MRRRSTALLAALSLTPVLLGASLAGAHELAMNTARITVRDDHVEVDAEIDVLAFVAAAEADPSSGGEADLAPLLARARGDIESGTRLDADGVPLPLTVRSFPTPAEVRAVATRSAAHGHAERSTIRLEASRPLAGERSLSLAFPRAMGPVLITLVQPSTRLTPAGATAAFAVLAPPSDEAKAASPADLRRTWLAGAAVILGIAAVLGNLALRRRKVDVDS